MHEFMYIWACICTCVSLGDIKMRIFPGCSPFFIYWSGVFQTQGLPIAVSLAREFSPEFLIRNTGSYHVCLSWILGN